MPARDNILKLLETTNDLSVKEIIESLAASMASTSSPIFKSKVEA